MSFSKDSIVKAGLAVAGRGYSEMRQLHSNMQARSILASIEGQRGRTDPKAIRLANEYARDVLGSSKYAPWLHVYSAVSGTFKEGWIPDNYYGLVVDPKKAGEAAKMVIIKSFTNRILDTDALPDLGYSIDGLFYTRDYKPLPQAAFVSRLFDGQERVFFKEDNSNQGRSVEIMTREDFRRPNLRLPDGVFQAPILQHPFFDPMSPKAVATLRITTARNTDGTISVKAAYLRGGRANDAIVRCRSHVRVSVDKETGALSDIGYLHDWRSTTEHPDTGFRFAGQKIPYFREATALVRSLHETCPHMLCIGWDVVVDRDDKVRIMEWNARYNDIKFSEATTGPCFRGLGWENLWRQRAAA